jgi:threonine/homoserine/homoserine lactone efflux protein
MPAQLARQVCSPSCDAVAVVGELHAAMESWVRQTAKGVGISGLNPKVFLLFLALLPQFTDSTADWPLAGRSCRSGWPHVASCALVYIGLGTGARLVLRAHPTATQAVTRFSGAAMVLVGVLLLGEQLVG